jgi:3-phenylpropionate/trans-cinnamate dioxygenase ferredoxin reductase subunit
LSINDPYYVIYASLTLLVQRRKLGPSQTDGLIVLSLFSKKQINSLKVNGGYPAVKLQSNETILSAALRSGIPISYSCRVGGCASCRCKLVKGKVKELTDSSYVLTQEELDQGFILTCQSVPKSDVEIETPQNDATAQFTAIKYHGLVTGQQKLTRDITRLTITLDKPINYTSGQYAELKIPSLCSSVRAYSFATPCNDKQIEFFIKKVNGGELSPLINSTDLLNSAAELYGPLGDFYLRNSNAPIVCIAGGSGLAPIKALLQQAAKERINRDVVFYFGARAQQDLYCTDEILRLKKQWETNFTYIPVLSEEPEGSSWQGHRGLVTDVLMRNLNGNEHAYLCGPPLMIDVATEVLKKYDISSSHIHFDKFVSKADIVAT